MSNFTTIALNSLSGRLLLSISLRSFFCDLLWFFGLESFFSFCLSLCVYLYSLGITVNSFSLEVVGLCKSVSCGPQNSLPSLLTQTLYGHPSWGLHVFTVYNRDTPTVWDRWGSGYSASPVLGWWADWVRQELGCLPDSVAACLLHWEDGAQGTCPPVCILAAEWEGWGSESLPILVVVRSLHMVGGVQSTCPAWLQCKVDRACPLVLAG